MISYGIRSGPGEVGRQEDRARESSGRVKGALYHREKERVKTGGSVLDELIASGLMAAVEPREAKSEACKFTTAEGSETKFPAEFNTIAEQEP